MLASTRKRRSQESEIRLLAGNKGRSERRRQNRREVTVQTCIRWMLRDREQDRNRNARMSDKDMKNGRKGEREIDGTWLKQGREHFTEQPTKTLAYRKKSS